MATAKVSKAVLEGCDHCYEHAVRVFDELNCGFVGRDAEGTIAFADETLRKWLGYETREDLIGRSVTDLVPPELRERIWEEQEALRAGDIRARLTVLQRRDSTTFPVLVIPHAMTDAEGEFAGSFAVIVDLGTIQTAKQTAYASGDDIRARLDRIAMELQSISLSAGMAAPVSLPLQHPDLRDLSPREKEVLALLIAGDRVPAIATQLHISPHTVRNHLKAIYRKVEVQSQSELIHRVRSLAAASA